MLIFTATTT